MVDTQDSITKSTGGGNEISIGVAKRGINDFYTVNLMSALNSHKQFCASLESGTDPALVAITRSCINSIADDKIRANLSDALDTALDAIYKMRGADPTQKGHLIIKACTAAVGECYGFADQFLGLTKVNCLVPIHLDPPTKEDGQEERFEEPDGETDSDVEDSDK